MQTNHSKATEGMTPMKRARLALKLTQVEGCRRTGVSYNRWFLYENGATRPSQQTAQRIATALERPVRDVFPEFDTLRAYGQNGFRR